MSMPTASGRSFEAKKWNTQKSTDRKGCNSTRTIFFPKYLARDIHNGPQEVLEPRKPYGSTATTIVESTEV
jgi:hypothetical protein